MRRAGEWEGERVFAWLCVLGAHLLFWWLLMRANAVTVPVGGAADDNALRMVWLDPPLPSPVQVPASTASTDSAPHPSPSARNRPSPRDTPQPVAPTPVAADASAAPAMTATFIEQGRQLLQPQGDFAPDPLANRIAALPGHGDGKFRMRKPRSVQRAVYAVGKLFGGGEFDPCPGIRQSIANLAADGDSEALRVELDTRRRAACP